MFELNHSKITETTKLQSTHSNRWMDDDDDDDNGGNGRFWIVSLSNSHRKSERAIHSNVEEVRGGEKMEEMQNFRQQTTKIENKMNETGELRENARAHCHPVYWHTFMDNYRNGATCDY